MENERKVIIFVLLFLIVASVSAFAFLFYKQKNQTSSTPTIENFQEKPANNQTSESQKISQKETVPTVSQNTPEQNQKISEEEINAFIIDGNLISLKTEENKLILNKKIDNEEVTINLNQKTLYSRIFLSINPATKKGEIKKQETIQLSDLKEGDDLSIKISPDDETQTAEFVRVILLEN